jgi:hypothetical protein
LPEWDSIIIYWDNIEVAKHMNEVNKLCDEGLPDIVYSNYIKTLKPPDDYVPWFMDCRFDDDKLYYFMMGL